MELALNLSWLLLALAALACWRQRVIAIGRNRHERRRTLSRLLSLVCTLAVLFPVISVTDDLHAEQAVMEDSSAWRRSLTSVGGGHASSSHGKLAFHPALIPKSVLAFAFAFIAERLNVVDSFRPIGTRGRVLAIRAPPAL